MVLEDMKSKVVIEAIACATQLDGLVVVEIKGNLLHVVCTYSVRSPHGLRSSLFGEKRKS
jgi:hypothetical protein